MKKLIVIIGFIVLTVVAIRYAISRWRKADPKVDAALASRGRKNKIGATKVYRGFRNYICKKIA